MEINYMKKCLVVLVLVIICTNLTACLHGESGDEFDFAQTTTKITATVQPTPTEPTIVSAPKEYTAEELSEKTVPEIIEIMGGEFYFDQSRGLIWLSGGGFYIYNDDKLPGFVFYIDEAQKDYEQLKETKGEEKANTQIRENLKNGKYQSCSFIAMYDSAKLNSSISADMDYRQFQAAYGYAPTIAVPPSERVGHMLHYGKERIKTVLVYYQYSGTIHSNAEKEDDSEMERINPEIFAIVALPQSLSIPEYDEETVANTENEWKQLYLDFLNTDLGQAYTYGTLVNVNNDDVPELVIQSDYIIEGNRLCWINNGVVENSPIGNLGSVSCTERSSIIVVDGLNRGIFYKGVYYFDGQFVEQIHIGSKSDLGVCQWDREDVTQEEYNTLTQEYSDPHKLEMGDYSMLISQIQNY